MADSPKKVIIDTDPGIDDAMAIFLALQSPELEVLGLTTIFGNVYTTLSTRNALHLLEIAGRTDIPVAEGSHVTITNGTKLRVADFVHGIDGLGNQNFPPPNGKPVDQTAAAFLVEQANLYPGEVTVVALGPLTNIALALQLDPGFQKKIGKIIILGGAFFVNGNVNPAAEANIFGDPEAADMVFTSGADVIVLGLNVTHQVVLTEADRDKLASSDGKFAKYLCKIMDVYFSYHKDSYEIKGVYLHDPAIVLAAVDPSLFTYTEGVVRVQMTGITRGLTILYNNQKRFGEVSEWCDKPTVKVAVTVDAPAAVKLTKAIIRFCIGIQSLQSQHQLDGGWQRYSDNGHAVDNRMASNVRGRQQQICMTADSRTTTKMKMGRFLCMKAKEPLLFIYYFF